MSSVELDYEGIGQMLRSDFMEAEMARRGAKVLAVAEATAPVDEFSEHPGRYKAAMRLDTTRHGGIRGDRAQAVVSNDSPEAIYVEYGNRNTPRHATLRRALNAARD